MSLSRRAFTSVCAAAAMAAWRPRVGRAQATTQTADTWLLFTKSSAFEHDVVRQAGDAPTFLHRQLEPLFRARGIRLVETKDGGQLRDLERYAGVVFYTCGDLGVPGTDGRAPLAPADLGKLLTAVHGGLPFIGLHCASDTYQQPDGPSEYQRMLGGAFESHGDQQRASLRIVDPAFPGVGAAQDWSFVEEWYALRHLADDIHPIHLIETAGMKGPMYERPPYAVTWTRQHGEGRVFYTVLGHREDVIAGAPFQRLVGGGIDWCRAR